jgi:hypothetical protein
MILRWVTNVQLPKPSWVSCWGTIDAIVKLFRVAETPPSRNHYLTTLPEYMLVELADETIQLTNLSLGDFPISVVREHYFVMT